MDKDKKIKQGKHVSQLLNKGKGESLLTACVNCDVSRATFNKWKAEQQDKRLIKDESAVSYPLFTIILTLIIGTACYIILTPAINIVSGVMNTYIADGTISVQTANAYAFNLNLYKILPLFMIIGLFLYAITQALLRKGTEG